MLFLPPELLTAAEEARLLTLTTYDILPSLREPVFDEFVALVTSIFKLPISLIALVGADEVGYKAVQGLPGLMCHPRADSICALAVRRNQAVVFTDLASPAQRQQLTAGAYSSVQLQQLRFYAGIPLRMPDQHVIGVFCIIDRQPRRFALSEQRVLEQLALLIERIIVVRHACLASEWLEGASWQAVQAYVIAELRKLAALARTLDPTERGKVAVDSAVLLTVVSHLNCLGSVLAEPLPGFA